jgi:hypothetical protein
MIDEADAPGGAYREIIREKDAQIDRLVFKLAKHQELITELCDAMERQMIYPKLVQRAREATR